MSPALLLLAAGAAAPPEPVRDLKLPPGFTATLFADNPLAPDIYAMTIDDDGRVLVAGRGYVRRLVDDDGDGSADRAVDLIDGLKEGPMGLLAEGDSLFVVCDGGLKHYRGYNGRDELKDPELLLALATGGEHAAHAVRRGPDGWLYLLCGNNAGVKKATITGDRSPVKEPIAGALLRLSPDFKTVEVVADGFRNPYSFDFNLDGEPFTYDSDNERCVGLPWYEGCRFYHIVPGGNHGWRSPQLSQTWRKPPYFPDVVPPVCDTGRGSPTGVACYRHTQFPQAYRGGFFLADWTFGRIFHVPLKPGGSSYSGKHEVFAEAAGTSGFAPTALAVHPKTGELFVSIGGRGTRGGVYRIRHGKGDANPKPLAMARRSLDFDKGAAKQWLADGAAKNPQARRQALELIARWWDKVPRAEGLNEAVKANLSHEDRFVRQAAGHCARRPVLLGRVTDSQARIALALAEAADEPDESLAAALDVLASASASVELKLEAARAVQLAFGDLTAKDAVGTVFEGYTFGKPPKPATAGRVVAALKPYWDPHLDTSKRPRTSPELDRELARILAGLAGGAPAQAYGSAEWLGSKLSTTPVPTDVRDDLHYLACLARYQPQDIRDVDGAIAGALLTLETKRAKQKLGADRHWGLRIDELAAALIPKHPFLSDALALNLQFGRLEHLRFVKYMKPAGKTKPGTLARRFLPAAERDPDSPFVPLIFEYLPQLPRDEVAPLLDAFWERVHLQDSVVRVLAGAPREGDQPRLVVGLKSLDPEVVRLAAHALASLNKPAGNEMTVAAIRALRRFPDEKPNAAVGAELVSLLRKTSGQKIGADAKAWGAWLAKADAAAAKMLDAGDGYDPAKWQARLAAIDWAKGDAARGRPAFVKATCAACHDRAGAVGPSLQGISKRFSRDDLLTAILQPGKDVSARYRPTRVVTTDDKAYTGILVYEATDGVILQTGADTAVRLAGASITSVRPVDASLMPTGLIDKLTDGEIADLIAYLTTLK
jgi:putative membrane-bound dehydrogenase-like protein